VKTMDCQQLIDAYARWLKAKFVATEINGVCEITTPFVDRNNDLLQIYVKRTDRGFVLTDDGYILNELALSGCEINTPKRKQMLTVILNGFGIRQLEDKLVVEAQPSTFPQKKHDLLQAMLAVNDLFVMASPHIASFFREDVEKWLHERDIRFTPSIKITGKSGYDHFFDFVVPASRRRPERVLRAISQLSRQSASAYMFSWQDTMQMRAPASQAFAVINDIGNGHHPDAIAAMEQYQINAIPWSHRNEHVDELAG